MLKYNLRINKARQREIKHIFLEILTFYIGEGLLSYTFDYRIARKLYFDRYHHSYRLTIQFVLVEMADVERCVCIRPLIIIALLQDLKLCINFVVVCYNIFLSYTCKCSENKRNICFLVSYLSASDTLVFG